ncbi:MULTISPECIES: C40 family peptidase [unclassified Flavobacterium]|jgi:cell wall-associated NlpC family hydrolase|uniref:C40 family peptidase n=1 Tax=unclassified Flavobacterium TaxID=196869 RepID=UPI0025C1B3BF|nr:MULTISPECIES: C40 family peptidase [unclassified Flavobacterium]
MISKKINPVKFATLIGLSVIVLYFIAYGSLSGDNSLPENDGTIVKNTLINPVETNVSLRDSIVGFGTKLLGKPYVAGCCSKNGFDCSGFVFYVFQHYKIQVPRSSSQFGNFGKEIPIESVKKGDILVFLSPTRNNIGHVGIVTNPKGKESDFIHASSGSEMKVIITSLKKEGYTRRFVKAVDVLSD